MEINPCLSCSGKDRNKNNPTCLKCEKRHEYVNRLEMKLNFSFSYGESYPEAAVAALPTLSKMPSLDA
jgi:hypothetical protein